MKKYIRGKNFVGNYEIRKDEVTFYEDKNNE
jgi:hypothetical protein